MLVIATCADGVFRSGKASGGFVGEFDRVGLALLRDGFVVAAFDGNLLAHDGDHGRGDHQGALPLAIGAGDRYAFGGASLRGDGDRSGQAGADNVVEIQVQAGSNFDGHANRITRLARQNAFCRHWVSVQGS